MITPSAAMIIVVRESWIKLNVSAVSTASVGVVTVSVGVGEGLDSPPSKKGYYTIECKQISLYH